MVQQTITSDAIIEPRGSSIICDGGEVNNIIDEFGTNVILRVVTKTFTDEYGDATESYSDLRRQAVVQSYSASDDEVKEGVFQAGQVTMTFKNSDEAYVVPGNRVRYGTIWYQISRVFQQPLVDTLYYLVATVQKI